MLMLEHAFDRYGPQKRNTCARVEDRREQRDRTMGPDESEQVNYYKRSIKQARRSAERLRVAAAWAWRARTQSNSGSS